MRAIALVFTIFMLAACRREGSVGIPTATPGPPPQLEQPTLVPTFSPPTLVPTFSPPTVVATFPPPTFTPIPGPTFMPTTPPWVLTPQPTAKPPTKPPRPPSGCAPTGCRPLPPPPCYTGCKPAPPPCSPNCQPPAGCKTYYYVVKPGDNLFRIGLRFGTTATAIARQNGIPDIRLINPGQQLRITTCW